MISKHPVCNIIGFYHYYFRLSIIDIECIQQFFFFWSWSFLFIVSLIFDYHFSCYNKSYSMHKQAFYLNKFLTKMHTLSTHDSLSISFYEFNFFYNFTLHTWPKRNILSNSKLKRKKEKKNQLPKRIISIWIFFFFFWIKSTTNEINYAKWLNEERKKMSESSK